MPIHPAIVHIPVALAVLIPLLAIGVLAFTWRSPSRSAAVLLLAAQLGLVGSGLVAMSSGEETEEVVERIVSERAIHEHEERAEVFVWVAAAGLLVAGVGLALAQRRRATAARMAVAGFVVVSLVVAGLGFRAGEAGGELVYVHGAARAYHGDGAAPAIPARAADDD